MKKIKLDESMSLGYFQKKLYKINKDNGFWEDPNIPEKIALAHAELSEALEEFRERRMETTHDYKGKPIGMPSELADTIIRVLDLAEYLGFDMETILMEKIEYNSTRGYKHGGKVC